MGKPVAIVRMLGDKIIAVQAGDVFCHDPQCESEPYYQVLLREPEDALRKELGTGPWPNVFDGSKPEVASAVAQMVFGKSPDPSRKKN